MVRGRILSKVREKENSQRHLEKSRAERSKREKQTNMDRFREVGHGKTRWVMRRMSSWGKGRLWTGAAQTLMVEKAVRKARMLVWTLKCIIIGTKGVWRLAWTLTFGKRSCLGSRNQFHRLLRNAVFYIALLKLNQDSHLGIIHCLWGTGVPFGLDLRFLRSEVVVP